MLRMLYKAMRYVSAYKSGADETNGSHQVIETPWIVIAVDVMRPLSWNKAEFAYILMIQDLFAKWVECRTLQVNGKSIKEALKDLILSRWGMRFLLTDNSTEFMNKTLQTFAGNRYYAYYSAIIPLSNSSRESQ